jgi:cytochrome b
LNAAGSVMIRVWDPFVRAFHWALALSFAVAWLSAERMELVHNAAGAVAGALVAARVVWGLVGPRYARFSQFVRSPATVLAYLGAIAEGSEPRFIGHNPAGGAMIVALLAAMAAAVATGWLLTTDAFWGSEGAQQVHSIVAHGVMLLVLAHLGGVVWASVRHKENLVGAMIVGAKRAAAPGDVM